MLIMLNKFISTNANYKIIALFFRSSMEDGLWAVGLTRSSVCGDELKSVVAGGPNSGALDVEAENDVRGSAEFSENM